MAVISLPLHTRTYKENRFLAKSSRFFLYFSISYGNALDVLTKLDLTPTIYTSIVFDVR